MKQTNFGLNRFNRELQSVTCRNKSVYSSNKYTDSCLNHNLYIPKAGSIFLYTKYACYLVYSSFLVFPHTKVGIQIKQNLNLLHHVHKIRPCESITCNEKRSAFSLLYFILNWAAKCYLFHYLHRTRDWICSSIFPYYNQC